MENSLTETGNPQTAFCILHDRLARFVARVDVELCALQIGGTAIVLEVIFSLQTVWH